MLPSQPTSCLELFSGGLDESHDSLCGRHLLPLSRGEVWDVPDVRARVVGVGELVVDVWAVLTQEVAVYQGGHVDVQGVQPQTQEEDPHQHQAAHNQVGGVQTARAYHDRAGVCECSPAIGIPCGPGMPRALPRTDTAVECYGSRHNKNGKRKTES